MVAWAACVVYMSVTCAYVLCVYYLNSVWRGQYGRCTFMLVPCLCRCTVCTVLVPLIRCSGMASTGNVLTYPRLYSYCTCTVAQCVLCLYPLYRDSAWLARAMYLFLPVFVLVLWLYHCTVCTVLVALVQCSGMVSTGNVPFTRVCTRTVRAPLHSAYCACTLCTVV